MERLVSKLKIVETDISSNLAETLISRYENRKNIILVSSNFLRSRKSFFFVF